MSTTHSTATKRGYTMAKRAEAAEATRVRILEATYELLMSTPYDEVTLQLVADTADVSVQTVLRKFGSKEGLLAAGAEHFGPTEFERRAAEPGDVAGAARALARRYEEMGDLNLQMIELERRNAGLADVMAQARAGHLAWLERVFEPYLSSRAATRSRQVAQLFGATDIYVWMSWRRHLGLSATDAERALVETLTALVARFETTPKGRMS